jgi:hypothetical protein
MLMHRFEGAPLTVALPDGILGARQGDFARPNLARTLLKVPRVSDFGDIIELACSTTRTVWAVLALRSAQDDLGR